MESLDEEDILTRRSRTFDRLSRLPVFSRTALKLLTIATEAESAREDFEAAFRSDPSLAADLLTLANSAEFGFRAKVASIPHAISLLGLERARSLACTIAMSFYLRNSACPDVSDNWKHSMASAALAEHLATVSSLNPPLLYSVALLHDIGRLGLQQTSQSDYSYLMAIQIAELDEALHTETALFGMNHCEAGGAMANAWGFPESLQSHIRTHHGHMPLERDPVSSLVQTACRLAEGLGYPETWSAPGAHRLSVQEALPPGYGKHAACAPEQLIAVVKAHFALASGLAAF
jgi:putative nucleotidyltransferase with HDIG domain